MTFPRPNRTTDEPLAGTPAPMSRRQFVGLGAIAVVAAGLTPALSGRAPAHASSVPATGSSVPAAPSAAPTVADFAAVRARWADLVNGGPIGAGDAVYAKAVQGIEASAAKVLATFDDSAGRTALFTNLPLGTASANVTASFTNLKTLAIAYTTPGTSQFGDDTILARIVSGLDFMTGGPYSTATPSLGVMHGYGNWWDWEIGAPQALEDTATLVYSALTPAQIAAYCGAIDYFDPDPTRDPMQYGNYVSTGANRLDLCRAVIVRGALGADAAKIAQGVAAIAPTLEFVTSGDGLYADGSWIQHGDVAYTGTYGAIWLGDVALLLNALAGTPWMPTDAQLNLKNVFFAARSAFQPVVYNGLMTDDVRGRAVARAAETDASDGLAAAKNFLILAGGADAADAAFLRSTAKGWLSRTPDGLQTSTSVLTIRLGDEVMHDAAVPAAAEPIGHTLFPVMARAVHRRPGWAVALSMASHKVAYYETGGGDNLHGWHTGDGMLYTYLDSDNTQYDDAFWPTVDPYRMPGTTVSLKHLADGQGGAYGDPAPASTWVGGATDGTFATVGQDLKGPFSTLVAKKSWFFLDDTVVCLGCGISCGDGTEVDTVVDNRLIGAGVHAPVTVDGHRLAGADSAHLRGVRWAHVGGSSGYVFPAGADLTVLRAARTGSWHDISSSGPATPITRDYTTLYMDHGVDPVAAEYAYMLMPGASRHAVAARAHDRHWLRVLSNEPAAQAIDVPAIGFQAVNFWEEGDVGAFSSNSPLAVMVRRHGNVATLCIADPTASSTSATLVWRQRVRRVESAPASVASASVGRELRVTLVGLDRLQGRSQVLTVRLA